MRFNPSLLPLERYTHQAHDYYTYTAIKYAKDAGHDTIVALLGGSTEEWLEAEETYTNGEGDSTPSGGLWLRHMDPETGLVYFMNDETGKCRPPIIMISHQSSTDPFHARVL